MLQALFGGWVLGSSNLREQVIEMKKKIVSWMVVLCFLLALSSGAYASEAGKEASSAAALNDCAELKPMEDVEDSGTCGMGLTWKLYKSGKLVISGKGDIVPDNYWKNNDSIQSVEIGKGITGTGNDAFQNCKNLKTVKLPSTLKTIGQWVFSNCLALQSIDIPDNVTSIGKHAFNNCASMSSVKLGAKLSIIDEYAFNNCTALTSVKFGKKLKTIESGVFMNCTSLTSISFPKSLRTIGKDAFRNCKSLRDVSLPEGLLEIGDNAFVYCTSLLSIALPESLQTIGLFPFSNVTQVLINPDTKIELSLRTNQIDYKYLNKITASNIKLKTSTKARTVSLKAKSVSGSKLTYKSKNKKIKVSSSGVVTIPKNFVGDASIIVSSPDDGDYASSKKTVSVSVTIPKAVISKVSSTEEKTIVIKWKKTSGISGYQLEVSSSKGFLSGKQIRLKQAANETSVTVVRLKSKSTYYVRVRALQNYNGTKYGPWSSTKKVKVK